MTHPTPVGAAPRMAPTDHRAEDPARLEIDRATARRFLVARHLPAPPRSLSAGPASVLSVMDRLGSLRFDPLDLTGRHHDLVLAARLDGYRLAWTDDHLYRSRGLYETDTSCSSCSATV